MLNTVHVIICLFIFATCLYRAKKSDDSLREEIRWSIAILGMASMAGALQWVWHINANPFQVALEAAIAALQWFTGRFWSDGAPERFRKP